MSTAVLRRNTGRSGEKSGVPSSKDYSSAGPSNGSQDEGKDDDPSTGGCRSDDGCSCERKTRGFHASSNPLLRSKDDGVASSLFRETPAVIWAESGTSQVFPTPTLSHNVVPTPSLVGTIQRTAERSIIAQAPLVSAAVAGSSGNDRTGQIPAPAPAADPTVGMRRYRSSEDERIEDDDRLSKRMKPNSFSSTRLLKEFVAFSKSGPDGIHVGLENDDTYVWSVRMVGPVGTIYEGAQIKCRLTFPSDYPTKPPVMQILTPGFYHPNVFPDGHVCISILHQPVADRYNSHEPVSEKWSPVLGVEQVLVSVLSMLNDPNCDSPANVEAAKLYKSDFEAYRKRVRAVVRRSQDDF